MELADGLHTSQSAITSWENGRREPDFKTIEKIATFFNVPLSVLLPSNDDLDSFYINTIAEILQRNPKIKLILDKLRFMSDKNLDVIISVATALASESNEG